MYLDANLSLVIRNTQKPGKFYVLTKKISLPFKPEKGDCIALAVGHFEVDRVAYDAEDRVWRICIVEERVKDSETAKELMVLYTKKDCWECGYESP